MGINRSKPIRTVASRAWRYALWVWLATFGVAAWTPAALALDLTIGMTAAPRVFDPHQQQSLADLNVVEQVFEPLIKLDADSQLTSGLAEKWRSVNDVTWEFKLRDKVRFHDGSLLTVDDVLYSIDRLAQAKSPLSGFAKRILAKRKVDARIFQLTTDGVYPLLLNDLTAIAIVKKSSSGQPIGTGPYRLSRFVAGQQISMDLHPQYWGYRPTYDRVIIRFMPKPADRVAAILKGSVDVIDRVPVTDLARIRKDKFKNLFFKESHRVVYLDFSQSARAQFITDRQGRPLGMNPLRNLKVRRAIDMAIDRDELAAKAMFGMAEPTGNLVPTTVFGHDPNRQPTVYDPEAARKLLVDAGYPNGFTIKLHAPSDYYSNEVAIAKIIATQLAAIGIVVNVEPTPIARFSAVGDRYALPMPIRSWATYTADSTVLLRNLLATTDPRSGFGALNFGAYSNPQVDGLLRQSLNETDEALRLDLVQQATESALDDVGIAPLLQTFAIWAVREKIDFLPRVDERTYAVDFRPVKKR